MRASKDTETAQLPIVNEFVYKHNEILSMIRIRSLPFRETQS